MRSKNNRRLELAVVIFGTTMVWLVILPWIANWGPVARHLELLEERRIDASAMFYTELEARPT